MSQTKKTFLWLRFSLLFVTVFFILASSYCGVSMDISRKNTLTDSTIFENDYVVVYKNPSIFNVAENSTTGMRIIVALSKIKIKSSKGLFKFKRGEVSVFTQNESYYAIKGDYFEIKIKNNHPKPVLPEKWFEPKKNKIVFDNDDFRIFEERLGAKEDRELHSHLQRLVVRLNNTHLTDPRFYPNGQEGKGIQVPNTVKFAEPVEHVVRNLSDIPVFNIVIEFKGK